MSRCTEKFEVPGDTFYGIEDHRTAVVPPRSGKDKDGFHVFARERFQVWRGGCGIGSFATLKLAREKIYSYAVVCLRDKRSQLRHQLRVVEETLEHLQADGCDPDPFKLARYSVDEYFFEKEDRLRAARKVKA